MVPALAVVVAVAAGVVAALGGAGASAPDDPPTTTAATLAVASDAPRFGSIAELVAASDAVVVGEVVSTARGRTFGEGQGATLTSRLVRLRVDEVLAGPLAADMGVLLVEEEGWSADGAELVVDGAPPSRTGDAGVWFLVDTGDATSGSWIVVNAQGRYLADGDRLVGADLDDPLIARIEAGGLDRVRNEVAAAVG